MALVTPVTPVAAPVPALAPGVVCAHASGAWGGVAVDWGADERAAPEGAAPTGWGDVSSVAMTGVEGRGPCPAPAAAKATPTAGTPCALTPKWASNAPTMA